MPRLALVAVILAAPGIASATIESARASLAKGDYPAAERAFREAARGAKRADALAGVARTLLETGRYADAARAAADATRAGAEIAGETVRAESLYAVGDRDAAIATLRRVADRPEARRARLWLGRLLAESGDDAGARERFRTFVDDYNADRIPSTDGEGLAYVAEAVYALGAFRDANDAFRESWRADATRVETQVRWAALFLEKYDAGHAEECLHDALEANPRHAEAHLVYARVKMEQGFDTRGANEEIDLALETNPQLAAAHALRAELALYDQDDAGAARHLETARRSNPKDLFVLSVAAAARWMAEDRPGFDRARAEVLRLSPRKSPLWEVLARLAEWEHRYDEIVELLEEALRTDPDDPMALAQIGLNRLRTGDEVRGLDELRAAWQRDRYNVLVFNTLNFYDEVIAKKYVTTAMRRYRLRLPIEEKAILERYVPRTLDRAWDAMTKRYGFTPRGPVQIELYASNEDFALRTSGLPDIGVQGVCFGRVVTALGPSGGPFNWGQIVWHELAHVFSIQLSRQRVPRWFTEGLAEWETIVARPEWVRENDGDLFRAIEAGKLPGVARLNDAFTHARSAEEVLVAYYASSQIVKYVIDRFGFEKVIAMLRLWGEGKRTPDVIRQALGISADDLDRDFRRTTLERLARHRADYRVPYLWAEDVEPARQAAEAAPADLGRQVTLGLALLREGEAEEAKAILERVVARDPRNRPARFALSDISLAMRDFEGARTHARALLATGVDSYTMHMNLAVAARAMRDEREYGRQICLAWRANPEEIEATRLLHDWLVDRGRDARALERLRDLVRLDQHDRESMTELLGQLREREAWDDLRRFGEDALLLDPESPDVHRWLGEAYEHSGRRDDAIYEYESALLCNPEDPAPIQNDLDRLRGRARRRI